MSETKNKIEELNKEYVKYSQSVVKLLSDSLKEGEYFLFTKSKGGGYGIVISREREELLGKLSHETKSSKLLDILEDNGTTLGSVTLNSSFTNNLN